MDDDGAEVEVDEDELDAEDWLSASETWEIVRKATAGPQFAIATRANAGLVRARAELLTMEAAGEKPRRIVDANVPADFWWATGHAALDQNWETGDFSTWIKHRIHIRAFGVRFSREDIRRMVPSVFVPEEMQPAIGEPKNKPNSRRGRALSKAWPEWVAELSAFLHERGVPLGAGSEGAEELISQIADRLAEREIEAPPRSTVQPTVAAVLKRLRED